VEPVSPKVKDASRQSKPFLSPMRLTAGRAAPARGRIGGVLFIVAVPAQVRSQDQRCKTFSEETQYH
jgi:hypothetical protein